MKFLYPAVILSGGASLLYQVAWTRRLASVTSATVTAQAVVLAIFMAGLGLGAAIAGRRSHRIRRPLLGYAVVEAMSLVIAIGSVPLISASDGIRTLVSGWGVSLENGLWFQLIAVSLFLLIPTSLLGASLPLVIEHAERVGTGRRGSFVSFLYGFNTLGAVAGCVIAGFWTVENYGLTATTWTGAIIALGAVLLAVTEQARRGPLSVPTQSDVLVQVSWKLLLAAALGGFIGLAAEVIWTRLIMLTVDNTVYAFTQVLAAVLLGISLSGILTVWLSGRAKGANAYQLTVRITAMMMLLAAVIMSLIPIIVTSFSSNKMIRGAFAAGSYPLTSLGFLAGIVLAAALVAMTLPMLVAAERSVRSSAAFGSLYAANTMGSVGGSLIAGFVILPSFGIDTSNLLLVLCAVLLGALLFSISGWSRSKVMLLAATTLACVLLETSSPILNEIFHARLPPKSEILEVREGVETLVMVTKHRDRQYLWINSKWVAGSGSAHPTGHQTLGHIPALLIDRPKHALGIALGTGQTFAAALDHGFDTLDCVEINEGVIELSKRWFHQANRGLLSNPRVTVHNNDGRAFLRATSRTFDLIVLEPLQAWQAGTSNLYSLDFYRESERVLHPHGIVAQWIPFYGQYLAETKSMVATGLEVFKHGALWADGVDGFLMLSPNPIEITPRIIEERIRDRKLASHLRRANLDTVSDFLSLYWLNTEDLEKWVADASVITDDHPFLEFRAAGSDRRDYPELLEGLSNHLSPLVAAGTSSTSTTALIGEWAQITRRSFVEDERLRATKPPGWMKARAVVFEDALQKVKRSLRLRAKYRDYMLSWSQVFKEPEQRIPILRRALKHDPDFAGASVNLGLLYLRLGRVDEARESFEHAYQYEHMRSRVDAIRNAYRDRLGAMPEQREGSSPQ